jgi:hypothetical protein
VVGRGRGAGRGWGKGHWRLIHSPTASALLRIQWVIRIVVWNVCMIACCSWIYSESHLSSYKNCAKGNVLLVGLGGIIKTIQYILNCRHHLGTVLCIYGWDSCTFLKNIQVLEFNF